MWKKKSISKWTVCPQGNEYDYLEIKSKLWKAKHVNMIRKFKRKKSKIISFWADFFNWQLRGQMKFEKVTRRAQEQFQMVLEKQSRLSSIVILLFFWAMCLISPSSMLVVALIFSVFHVHTYENFVCNVHLKSCVF